MVEPSRHTGVGTAEAPLRAWRRWPGWIGYAAGIWSLVYGLLGMWWTPGSSGFPFGIENDPDAALSVFEGVRPETGFRPMSLHSVSQYVCW